MMYVNEIFKSIQGESSLAGRVTTFVRLTGCNLRCTYCDTQAAYDNGDFMPVETIVNTIASHHTKFVCITGGEPLLQKEVGTLITKLCDQNYYVSVETNGTVPCGAIDIRAHLIIDVKMPDSGEGHSFLRENLFLPHKQVELKFVISSNRDFEYAENFCLDNNLFEKYPILYSPSFDLKIEKWLAKKIIQKSSSARLHLQLHKYI